MPKFFIETNDGDHNHSDEDGYELPGMEEARKAALSALPDMARGKIPDGDRRTFIATVRSAQGDVLYSATLSLLGQWYVDPPSRS